MVQSNEAPNYWVNDDQRKQWEEWYSKHGKSFEEVLGTAHHPEVFLPMLAHMTRYINGAFPMWKDDVDRTRCDILSAYLKGEDVPHDQLAPAIGLLLQAFSGACDRIWSLQQSLGRNGRSPSGVKRSAAGLRG